jgi:hypothetical protein
MTQVNVLDAINLEHQVIVRVEVLRGRRVAAAEPHAHRMHAIIQLVACEHLMRLAINGTQRHPAAMKVPEWQSIPIKRQSEIIRANYPGQ